MNNSEFKPINDAELESLLHSSVPFEPPEEIVKVVTPWKKAIKKVLLGLALNTLTLNFLYLGYILPVIGTILTILGLRVLRKENKWFSAYYVISLMGTAYKWIIFSLSASATYDVAIPEYALFTVTILFIFAQLTLFCLSLYTVAKKAGITPKKSPMAALIIWFAVLTILGLLNYTGFIVPIAMIIGFICILVSLNKITSEIDEIGYSIENAPVKINDGVLSAVLVVSLIAGILCVYSFFSGYKMQWEIKDENEHAQVQQIKENLISLGFPEKILDDMSAEDILSCKDATKVLVETEQVPFNDNTRVITVTEEITPYFTSTYEKKIHDVNEMTRTNVGVCLTEDPEGDGDWQIIHHFCWDINPGFYGTECIQLWPAYRSHQRNSFTYVNKPTGRVLYSENGVDYVSSYHSLSEDSYKSDDIFGVRQNTDIFATFSFKNQGENHRGYVMYPLADNSETNSLIDSWMNYCHQQSLLQYPAVSAKDYRKSGGFDSVAFRTNQRTFQIADRELN